MVNTHAGHDCVIGNDCTLANGALLAGHVELADRVTLGGNAVVHQFCRLGRLSMISGGAGTVQDVPPFCVIYTIRWVGSLNLVGLRRSGLSGSIDAIKAAFDILYCRRLPNKRAAETIDAECGHDPNCAEFAAFVRSTRRGVTPYLRAGRAARKTDDTTLGE
jgi:UDP-N-acetylglucosamine acyltransferase